MMANSSKRLQITLNAKKEKEKVILDYLASTFSPNSKIKEILYNFIISQYDAKILKDTQKEYEQSNTEKVKDTHFTSKTLKDNKSDTNVLKDTQNDDIALNLDKFDDEVAEVKKDKNLGKNELEQLQEFI